MGSQGVATHLNKSMKQKFAKQYGSNIQQQKYKSGAVTTSANTA